MQVYREAVYRGGKEDGKTGMHSFWHFHLLGWPPWANQHTLCLTLKQMIITALHKTVKRI